MEINLPIQNIIKSLNDDEMSSFLTLLEYVIPMPCSFHNLMKSFEKNKPSSQKLSVLYKFIAKHLEGKKNIKKELLFILPDDFCRKKDGDEIWNENNKIIKKFLRKKDKIVKKN